MKQYIFFSHSTPQNSNYKEYKIEASGMMEALIKAKKMKVAIEAETFTHVDLQFKGVVY
ncbi:hypothetical protein [Bacillus solitudinis]|uniref:hypothetical protein n=1 Tax=Bacillus solitudinis TaxID=2014074 RepID=UPI0012FE67DD|nr:hypothetical protein [Bacillus solitudinis]